MVLPARRDTTSEAAALGQPRCDIIRLLREMTNGRALSLSFRIFLKHEHEQNNTVFVLPSSEFLQEFVCDLNFVTPISATNKSSEEE